MNYLELLSILFLFSCSGNAGSEKNEIISDKQQEEIKTEETQQPEYSLDYLLGKFNPEQDTAFSKIPLKYCSREGMFLRKETLAAFIEMYDAAKKEGVNLKIISATRNFNQQKTIWEAKWKGEKSVNGKNLATEISEPVERAKIILRYSSMPGTSRHHWGTDIDINSLESSYFNSGEGKKIYEWLKKNASQFGFCQPYSEKNENRTNGYEEEKWHWSYMPLSAEILNQYLAKVKHENISGFAGAETAGKVDIRERYVKAINPACR